MSRSESNHSHKYPNAISKILALSGLYIFAASLAPSTAGSNIGLALVLLGTLSAWKPCWHNLRTLPTTWLIGGLTAYVVIHSLIFIQLYPPLGESSNPHWSHFARTTGILSLPVAWWLAREEKHLTPLLIVSATSLLIGLLLEIDFSLIERHGFGIRSAWGNPLGLTGFIASIGFMGCFIAGTQALINKKTPSKPLIVTLLFTSSASFLFILYGTQTRGAWIAVLVSLLIYMTHEFTRLESRHRIKLSGGVLLILAAAIVFFNINSDSWEKRTSNTADIAHALLTLDREKAMTVDPSTGLRLNMWIEGIRAGFERPLSGWGLGSKMRIAPQAELNIGGSKGHFHNLYVELLAGMGFPGLLSFFIVYAVLIRTFLKNARPRHWNTVHLIAMATFTSSLVILLTDIVVVGHTAGRAIWIGAVALLLLPSIREQERRQDPGH